MRDKVKNASFQFMPNSKFHYQIHLKMPIDAEQSMYNFHCKTRCTNLSYLAAKMPASNPELAGGGAQLVAGHSVTMNYKLTEPVAERRSPARPVGTA